MVERLVLGTVQLGIPYGRTAVEGLVSDTTAVAILDRAWDLGIRCIDTAVAYGDSQYRVSSWLRKRSHAGVCSMVTKIRVHDGEPALTELPGAVGTFRDCASVLVLTHGYVAIEGWTRMVDAATALGASVGMSVYDAREVREASVRPRLSRVQAPGSVVDLRALSARGDSGIPLDIRSVFLQGLWLDDPAVAERRVNGSGMYVAALRTHAVELDLRLDTALIGAMLGLTRPDDRLVLGFDAPEQLAAIERLSEVRPQQLADFVAAVAKDEALANPPKQILDPRSWPPV